MAVWRENFRSLAESGVTGTAEGDAFDLHSMVDHHAMFVVVSAGPSPAYKIQLQGEWAVGDGWIVLAEVDETTAPPTGEPILVVVEDKPARSIRAACIVTSGSVSPLVFLSSVE